MARPNRRFRSRGLCWESLETRNLLSADLRITELMASNDRAWADGDGNSSDWIELHNAGDQALDLAGWHLTDDARRPDKWTFPSHILGPDQYLVVFASGQDTDNHVDFGGNLHTNFKLSKQGEYLALTAPDLTVVDAFAPTFPAQFVDVSYGLGQRAAPVFFPQPTPGQPNGAGYLGVTRSQVTLSPRGGTFREPFSLSLAADTPGASIYYTTDGTVPDDRSPLYEGPVTIDTTARIRARVIQPDQAPGPVTSESYIRISDEVAQFRSQLPIMVIDNFGAGSIPNKGWNSTGARIQAVARQPAELMLLEPEGAIGGAVRPAELNSRIGIRVRGAFSSSWPEPGYSVEAWSDQDDDDADIAPLGMAPESDWALYAPNPSHDRSLIENTFLFELSRQMGHWASDYRYVEAFVNTGGGELTMSDYVGLYVIEERVERSRSRLDFPRLAADASSGGWLLEINRMDAISLEGELPKNFHTAGPDGVLRTPPDLSRGSSRGDDIPRQQNAYINFDDPGGYEINPVQRAAIEGWLGQMEDVLYGRTNVAWNDPANGYSKYIDVDSFIDYYILENLSKNGDALLLSMWIYNSDPNGGGKLTFGPPWDSDYDSYAGNPRASLRHRADRLWYRRLFQDDDFMQCYIDRWQALRDGPLSAANMESLIDGFFTRIGNDAAVRDHVANWPTRLAAMRQWVTDRADAIDQTLVARPQPSTDQRVVPAGFPVSLSAARGSVYYTTDGSDPRLPGGAVSPAAREWTEPLAIRDDVTIKARTRDRGKWSGLTQARFLVASELPVRITEINYQPHAPNPGSLRSELGDDGEQFEFVELTNIGGEPIDLGGVRLAARGNGEPGHGFQFTLAPQELGPGRSVVVVRDRRAFQSRFGTTVAIAAGTDDRGGDADQYNGQLPNQGGQITLLDSQGRAIEIFDYGVDGDWPARARGLGSSLERIDPRHSGGDPANWIASRQVGGSPATVWPTTGPAVAINEVLAYTELPEQDRVELHNLTGAPVSIDHWYLSNADDDYFRYQVADPTVIPAFGYVVFTQAQLDFDLDGPRGDDLWLIQADAQGRPLQFVDHAQFATAAPGLSVGPWPTASDSMVVLARPTFGGPNTGPKVGEIVITEVSFDPVDPDRSGRLKAEDFEFIELYNRTDQPIDVSGWQLVGDAQFLLPSGTVVEPSEPLVVVRFDPANEPKANIFRFVLGVDPSTRLVGPLAEPLDNVSGAIQLVRDDTAPADDPNFVPQIVVDAVRYGSAAPWPTVATGTSGSLSRTRPRDYGLFPSSWTAGAPSPGRVQFFERLAGDANDDGRFDAVDVLQLLQAGKYMTGQSATWSQGDFTGDGRFDPRDVVLALQQ